MPMGRRRQFVSYYNLVFVLTIGVQKIVFMKIIICDVGDAACAFVTSNNGHTMMIDCGSNDQKDNPVDIFKLNKQWLGQCWRGFFFLYIPLNSSSV